ncbi:hypothetical protein F4782DRAFT_506568 [Xylaria castorea]|nr:hypothetical protein F4782DRAFT_506568 [Xylaria castorea]
MSFGFSVGDFLAAGQLAADIIASLRDVGGSKSDYQAVILELECLQKTLIRLDSLKSDQPCLALEAVKYTALSCRRPLENFLGKIRKYEQSLGPWAKEGPIRSTVDKIRFTFGQKDDIQKFQSYLHIHIETINLLLSEHGLGKIDSLSSKADSHKTEILHKIDAGHGILTKLQDNVPLQTGSVLRTESLLNRLFAIVNGDVASSLASLESMVAQACIAVQRISSTVFEIKANMVSTDARWSFFQAPCMFEDALGRKIPVPSEYDLDLLHAIIRQRFQTGPGAIEVSTGGYDVFYANNSRDVLRPGTMIIPASSIKMAIRVPQALRFALGDQACPMPRCASITTTMASWGGRICFECGVWFDPTNNHKSLQFVELETISRVVDAAVSPRLPKGRAIDPISVAAHNMLQSVVPKLLVDRRIQVVANEAGWERFRYIRYSPGNFTVPSTTLMQQVWETIVMRDYEASVSIQGLPTLDTALAYVDEVKATFVASRQSYEQFLYALARFKARMLPITTLVNFMLLHLLRDEPALVRGFAKFLSNTFVEDMVTSGRPTASDLEECDGEQNTDSQLASSLDFSFMQGFTYNLEQNLTAEVEVVYDNYIDSDDDINDEWSVDDSEDDDSEDDDFEDAEESLV